MSKAHADSPVVENDLILVYVDEQPAFFARVEAFAADAKPRWWQVKMLVLNVPLKLVTWILRREQINGEPFTMNGTPIRIEKVVPPAEEEPDIAPARQSQPKAEKSASKSESGDDGDRQARILSLGKKKPT